MAELIWSEAQEEAIRSQNNNILVSAAAGSGKTAVLVERVIRMLIRDENPLDIDRLVIVTFTKAAAAQMKNKIFKALKNVIAEHPEKINLRQQLLKVQNARICTIDSLCAEIVRENIQDVDLDPGYRIADETEIRMLQDDVLSTLLEQQYKEGTEDFLNLVDYYTERNDSKIDDIIRKLNRFAESHPEPEKWIQDCIKPYENAADLFAAEESLPQWMQDMTAVLQDKFQEIRNMTESGLRLCTMNYGPYPYETSFTEILEFLENIQEQPWDYTKEALDLFLQDWKRVPAIRKDMEVQEDLKKYAQDIRKNIKKKLDKLQEEFFYKSFDGLCEEMSWCLPVARTLSELTIKFRKAFSAAKKERSIADFSDIAHYALKILIRYNLRGAIEKNEQGNIIYTDTADQMARSIDEIIVDEYQDTNELQEYLVTALSSTRFGRKNVFMVGDVKQSIYGFRMACPGLFTKKLNSYAADGNPQTDGKLVNLDRNFRSRPEVLNFTNYIFEQTMIASVGGVSYKNGHQLCYGGTKELEDETMRDAVPELYLIDAKGEQAKSLEAFQIAKCIEQLTAKDGYHYSDIAILTRTSNNPRLEQMLQSRGIPLLKSSGKGFFDSLEIRLILDLLNIIDNPYQDIPFAAVLYSPICSATAAELAAIKLAGKTEDPLFLCLQNYSANEKFAWFLEKLKSWRQKATYMGISDFVEYVLEDSGMYNILTAMPQGKDRKANIDFLKAKAHSFARGSYTGLFHFIRYIKALKESDVDFGTVNAAAESAQAVRLMTIHKSKGLEFPVVILAGCGKKYNETDLNSNIIPDRDLGLGIEYRDLEKRLISKSLLMQTIRQKQKIGTYAEEMRLLYVALTRAVDKLVITGSCDGLVKKVDEWKTEKFRKAKEPIETYKILNANSFLSLLGLALTKEKDTTDLYRFHILTDLSVEEERVEELLDISEKVKRIEAIAKEAGDVSELERQIGYTYPYKNAANIKVKLTASELENKAGGFAVSQKRYKRKNDADEELTGAERGNAYHRLFELLDYEQKAEKQIKLLKEQGKLSETYADTLEAEKIQTFLDSPFGKRMAKAAKKGKLYREKQFVMGYRTDVNRDETQTGMHLKSNIPDEELLLVQGIIDAFFLEEDPSGIEYLILVDYKTDKVSDENHYIHTYAPQLNAYADALTRSFGLPVKEKIIYSLELGKEIRIPESKQTG